MDHLLYKNKDTAIGIIKRKINIMSLLIHVEVLLLHF